MNGLQLFYDLENYKRAGITSSLFFVCMVGAGDWVFPEGAPVPTVFFQGVFNSHKQCAKYCGPQGFQALTGEWVRCKNALELIHTPFIGKELDEIVLDQDSDHAWYNPVRLLHALQRSFFARHILEYCYEITDSKPGAPTVRTHRIDFFKMNFAQERDIQECTQKIDLVSRLYPDADKILWGFSRGGSAVFSAHARHAYPGVRMVVVEGSFDTLDHVFVSRAYALAKRMGLVSLGHYFLELVSEYRKSAVNPINSIDSFPQGVPVVFITSKADEVVPAACTQEIINQLRARGKNP